MTEEQVRDIFDNRAKTLSYDDCVELVTDAIDASQDLLDILTTPIDRIAWQARCTYLAGYYDALQNIHDTQDATVKQLFGFTTHVEEVSGIR